MKMICCAFFVLLAVETVGSQEGNQSRSSQESLSMTSPSKRKFSAVENQIYQYINGPIGDSYESRFDDPFKAEAYLLIAASKEFKKPIIEVVRVFTAIRDSRTNESLTDAGRDTVNMRHLKDIGFAQRDGSWYFAGELVNMGTPLPSPDSMRPMQPAENQNIEVFIEASADISELKQLQIKGKTNLPDETELIIDLVYPSDQVGSGAQDKVTVRNGQFQSAWFSDHRRPLKRLEDGTYLVKITTPTASVLRPSVKAVLAEQGRNMTGKLVEFDEIWGNRAKFEMTVSVQ